MPRAGQSHSGRALCTVVAEWRLHSWKTPAFSKTATPTNHLPSLTTAPSAGSTTPGAHCSGCIPPCSGQCHVQSWPLIHWKGSVCSGCWRVAPPQPENSSNQQNQNPHKPPAQPGCSTQGRLHHTCRTLQRLHVVALQWPMAYAGLVIPTMAWPCVLWFPRGTSSAENSRNQEKRNTLKLPAQPCRST